MSRAVETRLRRDRPEPSYTSAPATSIPSPPRVSSTPAAPASNDPVPEVARPTWWPTTSAPSLSLTSRIRSATCDSGALSTEASSSAPAGATTRCGCPSTRSPAARRPSAKTWAAASDGSSDLRSLSGSSPPSTMSEVIGLTMSSGT